MGACVRTQHEVKVIVDNIHYFVTGGQVWDRQLALEFVDMVNKEAGVERTATALLAFIETGRHLLEMYAKVPSFCGLLRELRRIKREPKSTALPIAA